MNLHQIGLKYGTDKATYHGYLPFYQKHLPGRHEEINLLEIGVKDGASLKMWREYYPNGRIVGIDINPPIRIDGCDIYQLDASKLHDRADKMLHFHVIIDDGSHMTSDQQITFYYFVQIMQPGDVYIIEDIHTSDWPQYRDTPESTEDFVRNLVTRWPILIWQNPENPGDSKTMLIVKP